MKRRQKKKPKYLPTPEQIADATAKVRAGWNTQTRQRRGGCGGDKKDKDYVPVVCRFHSDRNTGIGIEVVEGVNILPVDGVVGEIG